MEFSYTKKLGYGRNNRFDPLIPIKVIGQDEFEVYCLVDSGSPCNLFSTEIAEAAGIDLTGATLVGEVHAGGKKQPGYMLDVAMEFLGKQWTASVVFYEHNEDNNLLGGESFFQYFDVHFRYYERKFDILPVPDTQWQE
ncbi:MAG: hypothetical protein WEC84_04290 [Candidatus Andersenbacteria bacterium]